MAKSAFKIDIISFGIFNFFEEKPPKKIAATKYVIRIAKMMRKKKQKENRCQSLIKYFFDRCECEQKKKFNISLLETKLK